MTGGAGSELPAPVPPDRDRHRLVPLRVERLQHRPRRREGNVVLARAAAGEHGHPDPLLHCPGIVVVAAVVVVVAVVSVVVAAGGAAL